VLFTDGVSEAFDANGELFGEDRLLAHLATATATATAAPAGAAAGAITAGVLQAVRNHAAGTKQSDDITVVSVRDSGTG
jgi:phosphoserine phosphatase RsbU/P